MYHFESSYVGAWEKLNVKANRMVVQIQILVRDLVWLAPPEIWAHLTSSPAFRLTFADHLPEVRGRCGLVLCPARVAFRVQTHLSFGFFSDLSVNITTLV